MSDNLVARLRNQHDRILELREDRMASSDFLLAKTLHEAADHIESLEQAIRSLMDAHDLGDVNGEAKAWSVIRKIVIPTPWKGRP